MYFLFGKFLSFYESVYRWQIMLAGIREFNTKMIQKLCCNIFWLIWNMMVQLTSLNFYHTEY